MMTNIQTEDGAFDMNVTRTLTRLQTKEIKANKDKYVFVPTTSRFDFPGLTQDFYELSFRILVTENGTPIYLKNRIDCIVIESFDGNLYINILDNIHIMQEVPEHSPYSTEFDEVVKEKKPGKVYIHQWNIHGNMLHI